MPAGRSVTYPRVVELLSQKVAEIGQRAVARESAITHKAIQRYLGGQSEPTQASLEKLARYFMVSVPYLRGELIRTRETGENADYLTKRGKAYLEIWEIVPDHLKEFVLQDMMMWRDDVFTFEVDDMAALTEDEEKSLDEVKDEIDRIIEPAERETVAASKENMKNLLHSTKAPAPPKKNAKNKQS